MSTEFPTFIDFEASSLDLVASYPIEVGICLPDGEVHSWLIKPHVLWQDWSEKAARIHGIGRDVLEREGSEITEVTEALNKLIPDHAYCDAWTFDSFWLHRLFKANKSKPAFQLDSISSLLNDEQVAQWQDCHRQVIHDLRLERHRAANDARILHETWRRLSGQ